MENNNIIWYRLNINYLSKEYNDKAFDISEPCGDNEKIAFKKYNNQINKNEKCLDNPKKTALVDLTQYIYDNNTDTTTTKVIIKNY